MTTKVTRDVLDGQTRPITTIDINGGTIDGTPIGSTSRSTGAFTSVDAVNLLVTGSVNFTGASTTGISAFYADLAECYKRDQIYEPGTVVRIGGLNEITATKEFYDSEVFGVIRTNPAYLMNKTKDHDPLMLPVAMIGRVPCFVYGSVKKGDRLYAWVDGMAVANSEASDRLKPFARSLVDDDRQERRLIEVAIITIK